MTILPTVMKSSIIDTPTLSQATLVYFRARFKHEMYNALIKAYKLSGQSKADLARKLGKDAATISRLFAGPGNLTLDTVSDLLVASNGAVPAVNIFYPLAEKDKLLSVNKPVENAYKLDGASPFDASRGYFYILEVET